MKLGLFVLLQMPL